MEMSNQGRIGLVAGISAVAVGVVVVFWLRSGGYGEVSPQTYQFSKALYSACQSKSEERLNRIEALLDEADESDETRLPPRERKWIEAIIRRARNGNWESATKQAHRMMSDQVKD